MLIVNFQCNSFLKYVLLISPSPRKENILYEILIDMPEGDWPVSVFSLIDRLKTSNFLVLLTLPFITLTPQSHKGL